MGISGLVLERSGNVMGAVLCKRWEGAPGPEVVARWDPGVHYFARVRLDEMRHGRGRENGARGWPGVTLGTGAGARVGGSGIGYVSETRGTLGDKSGVLKGVGNARSKMVVRC